MAKGDSIKLALALIKAVRKNGFPIYFSVFIS